MCQPVGDSPSDFVRLSAERVAECASCGHTANRDVSAARNILQCLRLWLRTGHRPRYLGHACPGVAARYALRDTLY